MQPMLPFVKKFCSPFASRLRYSSALIPGTDDYSDDPAAFSINPSGSPTISDNRSSIIGLEVFASPGLCAQNREQLEVNALGRRRGIRG